MTALHEILKKIILDALRSVQPPNGWKVVVADAPSLKIIESACKKYDILDEKVTLVENFEKVRQPYPQLEAVYMLSPTNESIDRVIEDFSKATPLYSAANLFFISALDGKLNQKLRSSPVSRYIKKCDELFIDFAAKEARVYSTEDPQSFFRLYSPVENFGYEDELRKIAKNLLSVCVTLGENPSIRYQKPSDHDFPTKSLSYKLAMLLQAELDQYIRTHPKFPPQDNPRPQAVFFIFDRTIDMYTPILHEFTYQAMANDLLEIEDGRKYSYSYVNVDGIVTDKEAILDEDDNLWVEIRHKHMKDCIEKLMKDFHDFLGENAGFANDKDEKASNLNDIKKLLVTLPQFQKMKEKFSVHLNIAQDCMSLFEKERLEDAATIEQDCATGFTHEGIHPKTLIEDMVPLLDNPVFSSMNKVRLLMLYMMYKNGVLEEDRIKLLEHARITLQENDAINNLVFFGVRLLRPPSTGIPKKNKKYRQKPGDDDIRYQISRYIPKLKLILENHIKGSLDNHLYPYTKAPAGTTNKSKVQQQAPPVSLRSARPGWYKTGPSNESRAARILVFVAGGVTYSELRSAYELSEKRDKDVIIGSTHIITPTRFIEDLKILRNPPTRSYQQQPLLSLPSQTPPQSSIKTAPQYPNSSHQQTLTPSPPIPPPKPVSSPAYFPSQQQQPQQQQHYYNSQIGSQGYIHSQLPPQTNFQQHHSSPLPQMPPKNDNNNNNNNDLSIDSTSQKQHSKIKRLYNKFH